MKTTNKIFSVMAIVLFMVTAVNTNSFAQEAKKYDECKIKVEANCNSCKAKIEKNMAFEKGIKDVNVDLETKVATLKFKTEKTSPEKLLAAVQKLGYKAKLVKSDTKVKSDLNKCNDPAPCKKTNSKSKKSGCCSGKSK